MPGREVLYAVEALARQRDARREARGIRAEGERAGER